MGIEKAKFVPDVTGGVPSSLVDLSEGGMYITIDSKTDELKIKEGANVEVKISLDEKEVTLKGKVLRHGSEEKSYAIEFYDSEPRNLQVVKRFVQNSIDKLKEKK